MCALPTNDERTSVCIGRTVDARCAVSDEARVPSRWSSASAIYTVGQTRNRIPLHKGLRVEGRSAVWFPPRGALAGVDPKGLGTTMTKKLWKLDEGEITWGWSASTSTQRRKLSRASRSVDLRSERLWLEHKPTGIRVEGELHAGHRTKKTSQALRKELFQELLSLLEKKVAKRLNVPGRAR